MKSIVAHPQNEEQLEVIQAFLKALKIKFESKEELKYDPEFVQKILEGKKEIEDGGGIKIAVKDLWK